MTNRSSPVETVSWVEIAQLFEHYSRFIEAFVKTVEIRGIGCEAVLFLLLYIKKSTQKR